MIVLWDIDGTLIENDPDGVDLYLEATRAILGPIDLRPPSRHGKTDRQIVSEYVALAGGTAVHEHAVTVRLEALSQARYTHDGARRPLPGVGDALVAMADLKCSNALLTGNSRSRSEAKLSGAGIRLETFDWDTSFFGSEFATRPEMARFAASSIGVGAGVVIGDTPGDAEAAMRAGIPFIGVTTGIYGPEDLRIFRPFSILRNLKDDLDDLISAMISIDGL